MFARYSSGRGVANEENHGVSVSRGLPVEAPPSKQVNISGPSAQRTAGLLRDYMIGRAAKVGQIARRLLRSGICLGFATCASFAATSAQSEGLPEALAKAYQTNPQLNAERARQRATDENIPQALSDLVMECIRLDPTERPRSMDVVVKGLEGIK